MRFILMVKATEYAEAGVKANRERYAEWIEYRNSLAKAGVLLAAEELLPSSAGVRISYPNNGEEPSILAGPFTVNHDLVASFYLIDVMKEDEALQWALRMPIQQDLVECNIEVRRLKEDSGILRSSRLQVMEADLQEQMSMLKNF